MKATFGNEFQGRFHNIVALVRCFHGRSSSYSMARNEHSFTVGVLLFQKKDIINTFLLENDGLVKNLFCYAEAPAGESYVDPALNGVTIRAHLGTLLSFRNPVFYCPSKCRSGSERGRKTGGGTEQRKEVRFGHERRGSDYTMPELRHEESYTRRQVE